jgi:hypothetical protein
MLPDVALPHLAGHTATGQNLVPGLPNEAGAQGLEHEADQSSKRREGPQSHFRLPVPNFEPHGSMSTPPLTQSSLIQMLASAIFSALLFSSAW